jgi:alpha-1,3-rhamnosyl/mannosyltransferase
MKIALGANAGSTGGPSTFAIELVRGMLEVPGDHEITVLTDRPAAFCDAVRTVALPMASAWQQPLWDHVSVGRALRRERFDLYHATKGVLPRLLRVPGVVSIHDLAVNVMPETFSRAQRLHLLVETASTVRRAGAIITGSRSTARDLERFYPASVGKTDVVPYAPARKLGPPSEDAVEEFKRRFDLAPITIGYLGTMQPRKNVDLLAHAFRDAAGERPWQLVLAGRMRPGYRPECLSWGDSRVRYLGELDDEDVSPYLAALACMVSPSAYEGFGLTFIEAMAVGCPVIGVANSSVPEVVGDAGVLIASADRSALVHAIERVVGDMSYAAELSRRGVERAALFSWKQTARATLDVYERLL